MSRREAWRPAAAAAALACGVAILGAAATDLGPWYTSLRQPDWKPPDRWFGPAWTAIFGLTAWAGARVWQRADARGRRRLLVAGLSNGALNVLWSLLFFTLRRPDWALAEVTLLWASIAALIIVAWHHDRLAAFLLIPYLLWVSFAAALNGAVVTLNPSIG